MEIDISWRAWEIYISQAGGLIFLKVFFCLTENRVLKNESCGELIYPDQTRPEIPETHQEPWMKILWEKPILLNYVSFVDFILRIFVFHGNPLDSEGWVTSVFGLSRFSDFLKKVSSYVRDFLFFQGKTKTSKICYIKYSHFWHCSSPKSVLDRRLYRRYWKRRTTSWLVL